MYEALVKVGQPVPDFDLSVFDPEKNDFGKISLQELMSQKKWTLLFFYSADFTFV
jgi:alkyl hydroperoxide reductase subunit AhpC